ncbi:DUF5054 domain-containing protein [Kiritimatiellaeota bacterium B1221]|nr:DUF5054 domain-containing protein [Kiritimatiellaeota bacterium B1221]
MLKSTQTENVLTQIGVVFKTHLDIGFTDLAEKVLATYMDHYIPAALELARETRNSPSRFVWTTGSWIAWHFLETATPAMRKKMEDGILAGDFHWHALPFTSHTELMNPDVFRAGLDISHRLDERFGRQTTAAKLTDVPGHTCAMIPYLAEAGIRMLHIGINPASAVVQVPPVFRWVYGEDEVVVIYDEDYGSLMPLPGNRGLSVNFTGDNLGPQSPEAVAEVYAELQQQYPDAEIAPANLSTFADSLWAEREGLPAVDKEMGDSWIHGAGTDPGKVARYRELSALRSKWLKQERLSEGGKTDQKLSEALLLTAEHTWGMDLKSHLKDWQHYSLDQFESVRQTPPFQLLERSWQEQRQYVADAIVRLPEPLRTETESAMENLTCRLQPASGWQAVDWRRCPLQGWEIEFDPQTAAVLYLKSPAGKLWADASHVLASLSYQHFSADDYHRLYDQYIRGEEEWSRQDFTKPGLGEEAESLRVQPRAEQLYRHESEEALLVEFSFPEDRVRHPGVPAKGFMEWRVEGDLLQLRLEWRGKVANRMPEALWLSFVPPVDVGSVWEIEKLGRAVQPRKIVNRGAGNLHAMDRKVWNGVFELASQDAPLVALGAGSMLNYDGKLPEPEAGISVNLCNNIWGTNFPMWIEGDAVFRFQLRG